MTKDEFKELRDLPSKSIANDLKFIPTANASVYRCEEKVENSLGYEVILNASYNELLPSVIFNFRISGIGAICRYCVNGTIHKDADTQIPSRTHKHSLQTDICPNNNIPYAKARTDFQITSKSDIELIWQKICREANINHSGKVIVR